MTTEDFTDISGLENRLPDQTLSVIKQAVELIRKVLTAPSNQTAREIFLIVEDDKAKEIFEKIGLSVFGFQHVIDRCEINKILRDQSQEPRKGQLSITNQDFEMIPLVVLMPDEINKGSKIKRGGFNAIRFKKRVNGWLFVVEEIRTGKKHLAIKSMYKYPAAYGVDRATESLAITSETPSDTPPVKKSISELI